MCISFYTRIAYTGLLKDGRGMRSSERRSDLKLLLVLERTIANCAGKKRITIGMISFRVLNVVGHVSGGGVRSGVQIKDSNVVELPTQNAVPTRRGGGESNSLCSAKPFGSFCRDRRPARRLPKTMDNDG